MSHQQQLDPTEVAKVQRDIKLLYVAAATFSSIGFYMTFYLPNLYKLVGVTGNFFYFCCNIEFSFAFIHSYCFMKTIYKQMIGYKQKDYILIV